MPAAGIMCDFGATFGSRYLGTAIAGKASDNIKMPLGGHKHQCGANFGSRCLDLGSVIAGNT